MKYSANLFTVFSKENDNYEASPINTDEEPLTIAIIQDIITI